MQNSRVSRIKHNLLTVYYWSTREPPRKNLVKMNSFLTTGGHHTGTMMMLYESICGLAEFLDKNFE